jgi:hypothetical protein
MGEISTCQQAVDMGAFGPNFDNTFKSHSRRPGKTKYVLRNGELVEKVSDDLVINIPTADLANMDWLALQYGVSRRILGFTDG